MNFHYFREPEQRRTLPVIITAMVKEILLVGIGGALGSILRYGTGQLIHKNFPGKFPLATLCINVIGCLLIGILMAYFLKHQTEQAWKLFFVTGFCGGYTTFSAFAAENIALIQHGQLTSALLYIGLSVVFGLLAVCGGILIFRHLS